MLFPKITLLPVQGGNQTGFKTCSTKATTTSTEKDKFLVNESIKRKRTGIVF
jgi:hypothetical protein